ncbi:DUF1906 domain-containing protein [Mycolicibacterium sp.]|uniref:DUF1906 domain-containing protein n=1 Tax=Mycolicibacterium sp. TaxID=2320850 RepID=UPI001DC9BE80|nr:DUF1906 domain-containing protein [Mycolicibacterium sp.]MCB1290297.1 DUF1906 domain-containing protein [Mycobacterium sp.]MCB9409190.1 DUF1906 domain-containing protein [Mycolicibacterium sp.]
MSVSRRDLLKFAAAAPAAAGLGALADAFAPAAASADSLGVLLDYAAGVLSAAEIKAAGALGAIRYVSDRRPGAQWMLGKPMQIDEARDLYRAGLKIVSNYQFGKQDTADWLGGQTAGVTHAKRGWALHTAAGGPVAAPIYASIDDNPSYEQYKQQVAPYLRGWESVLGHQRVGIYGNSKTIDWALQDGLGSWFWQHNWGSPRGFVHPAAHLHQFEIDARSVAGVGVDLNNILKPQFGQWD